MTLDQLKQALAQCEAACAESDRQVQQAPTWVAAVVACPQTAPCTASDTARLVSATLAANARLYETRERLLGLLRVAETRR
jgi:hypothetical protein